MGQFSGAGAAAAENKALAEAQTPAAPGFEETLIKYLAKHIIAQLKPSQLPGKDGEPRPYIYSEKFYKRFADAIKVYWPRGSKNRRIRNLGTMINPNDLSDEIFAYQFHFLKKMRSATFVWNS